MTAERRFEDFVAGRGEGELFDKVQGLDTYLANARVPCLDALSYELLAGAGPRTVLRMASGERREAIHLASNSFLDLTRHPEVVRAAREACERYGYGMGAVPVYAGTTDLHRELERRIAAFLGQEAALLLPCGYSGNIGVIAALCGKGDVVINDAANHASIFDGGLVSGADMKVYLHGNPAHLERILKRLPASQRGRLIVTDGVFSMDGDLGPLDAICDLASRHGARVMVDDAHGIGVVGPTGRGTPEVFHCLDRVDILYGTLSKAPGGLGGYAAGSRALIQYLRTYARSYFFSTALPPPIVAGLIAVFDLFARDAAGRPRLMANVEYLTRGLRARGFDVGHARSAIVPVMVGDEAVLGALHRALIEAGIFTNVVTYPAVRRKACRLRLNVMSTHTREDLDRVLDTFGTLGRHFGLVP